MKLFGHPMSTCTRKVLTVLAEKGQKAEFVTVDIMKGEGKSEEHLPRQPFGQVPAIDDDGFALYESRAIMRYLDKKLPGTKLTPTDPHGEARMEQWISVEQSNFSGPAMKVAFQTFFNPFLGKPVDEAALAEGKAGLARALPVLDKQLAKTPYLAGDEFTLADITYMPYLEYVYAGNGGKGGEIVAPFERVDAWWKKISDRASWKTATGKAS